MANEETKPVVEDEIEEDTPESDLTDKTDWQAEAKKARGIASRLRTKLTKATEKKVEPTVAAPAATANKGFDYAQKAYLKSSGIAASEFALVQEVMEATGKSLDDVLDSKHFQGLLKEQREDAAAEAAVPTGTKRASNPTRDSVEYWIGKGELPPADQPELRRKVVNARIAKEKEKSHFSPNPVV